MSQILVMCLLTLKGQSGAGRLSMCWQGQAKWYRFQRSTMLLEERLWCIRWARRHGNHGNMGRGQWVREEKVSCLHISGSHSRFHLLWGLAQSLPRDDVASSELAHFRSLSLAFGLIWLIQSYPALEGGPVAWARYPTLIQRRSHNSLT